VSILGIKKNFDFGAVGQTLGFVNLTPDVVDGVATAETLPNLVNYKELYIHLEGLSTSENPHNQSPSTLLRAIPVKTESCNSGRSVVFDTPHFKRLENGTLSGGGKATLLRTEQKLAGYGSRAEVSD
jgi:hypothetical protein